MFLNIYKKPRMSKTFFPQEMFIHKGQVFAKNGQSCVQGSLDIRKFPILIALVNVQRWVMTVMMVMISTPMMRSMIR